MRKVRSRQAGGFALLETLLALVLLAISLTALAAAFAGSGQYGVMARRQATATIIARSVVNRLSLLNYSNALLVNNNNNAAHNADFADSLGNFAGGAVPTGTYAPDVSTYPDQSVNGETYNVFINVAPEIVNSAEQGKDYAVIVRYSIKGRFYRAVSIGYKFNPAVNSIGSVLL